MNKEHCRKETEEKQMRDSIELFLKKHKSFNKADIRESLAMNLSDDSIRAIFDSGNYRGNSSMLACQKDFNRFYTFCVKFMAWHNENNADTEIVREAIVNKRGSFQGSCMRQEYVFSLKNKGE